MLDELVLYILDKPGEFSHALDALSKGDVNVFAFSIDEAGSYAIIRLIVDKTDRAKDVLAQNAIGYTVGQVHAVKLPNVPGMLRSLTKLLADNDFNMKYGYQSMLATPDSAVVIMKLNSDNGLSALLAANGYIELDNLP